MLDPKENKKDESADCPIISHIHIVRMHVLFPLYV